MKGLLDRKAWEGPLGIARIVLGLSAVWLLVTVFTGFTAAKLMLPMVLMMLALGFLGGYQMGQSKRS
jgi:hypothetical protein